MANQQPLIIPFASNLDESCQAASRALQLPNLTRWLQNCELIHSDESDEFDVMPPHERTLSRLGAAPIITLTPCHWTVGIDHIRMNDPDDLDLQENESRSLFETMQPYFLEDGITLNYASALRWQVSGQAFNDMPLASLDRVIGRNVDAWQLKNLAIRRLQNEMQMLLYTHPVNDAREAKALPTVNSFWISRLLTLPDETNTGIDLSLRSAAIKGDWQAWTEAWERLDQRLDFKTIDSLTLCGERHAKTYQIRKNTTLNLKIKNWLQPKINVRTVLASL